MATYVLTTGNDNIPGTPDDDVVNATSSTLNSGDVLAGGDGTDTLALFGGGTFRVDQLAAFSGFEALTLTNTTSDATTLHVGDASLTITATSVNHLNNSYVFGAGTIDFTSSGAYLNQFQLGSGTATIDVSDAVYNYFTAGTGDATITATAGYNNSFTLGAGDATITATAYESNSFTLGSGHATITATAGAFYSNSFTLGSGAATINSAVSGNYNVTVTSPTNWNAGNVFNIAAAANFNISFSGGVYDLSASALDNLDTLSVNSGTTVQVTSTLVAGVTFISGSGALTTAAAALDLSSASLSGIQVTSLNATGTAFTVKDASSAFQVQGGAGSDTIVASGFTFTEAERDEIFAFQSIEAITDSSGSYAAPPDGPARFTLTTGADSYAGTAGNDLVIGTAATLNAGDQLAGGDGTDKLALFGSGTFRLDQLAGFSGFETLTLSNRTSSDTTLYVGDASLSITATSANYRNSSYVFGAGTIDFTSARANVNQFQLGSGTATINVSEALYNYFTAGTGDATITATAGYNNSFTLGSGDATITATAGEYNFFTLGAGHATITATAIYNNSFTLGSGAATINSAANGNYYVSVTSPTNWNAGNVFNIAAAANFNIGFSGGAYDLSASALDNLDTLSVNSGTTVQVTSTSVAGVTFVSGSGALTTAAAALDLSSASLSGIQVTSLNATGTAFTVKDASSAFQVQGGAGSDTIVASGFTFTEAERDEIFAFQSIEAITDLSGSYTAPPDGPDRVRLTTAADSYDGTTGDDLVIGTAATLNAGDQLAGGDGTDTLSLFGSGTFRLDQLSGFSGFETLTLSNRTSGNTTLYVGDASLSITATSVNYVNNAYVLGAGTIDFTSSRASQNQFQLGGGTATINVSEAFYNYFTAGAGDATITATAYYYNSFTLGSGHATITATSDSNSFTLGSGAATINSAASGDYNVTVNSPTNWNTGNVFNIAAAANFNISFSGGAYDLSASTLDNLDTLFVNSGATVQVTSTSIAGATSIFGSGVLTTAAAALDLSSASLSSIRVTSLNATGTAFTVKDATSAFQVQGGAGSDTIVASNFTFTQTQRDQIFAFQSIETIEDNSGTYHTPYPTVEAFLANDTGLSDIDGITSDAAISGSGDPDATVTIRIDGGPPQTITADPNGLWSFTPTGLSQGAHVITASESNIDDYTRIATVSFTYDTLAPAITNLLQNDTGINGDRITSVATLTGTTEANTVVSFTVDSVAAGQTTSNGSGVWTFTPSGLLQGEHTVLATATDTAGNSDVASLTFTLDTLLPAPPVITGIADDTADGTDGVTGDNALVISGTAEPDATVEVLLDGVSIGTATADGSGDWIFDYSDTPLDDGAYVFTAVAADAAGNASPASDDFNVTVDTQAPAAPVITGITDDTAVCTDGITSDNTLVISGTAEPYSTVEVRLDGVSIGTATACGCGDWTFDYSDTPLDDGAYVFTAIATDAAGNASPLSDDFSVTIDTQAPAAPVITSISDDTGQSDSDGITSDNTLVISGTAEPYSTVDVLLDCTLIGTATTDNAGNWSFDFGCVALPDGCYVFTAVASDAAGNVSPVSDDFNVTIDTEAPTAPVIFGISNDTGESYFDGITNDNTLLIGGIADPYSDVEVLLDGVSIGTVTACGCGEWIFDYTATVLGEGYYTFTAQVTDTAGNVGTSGDFYVTIDRSAATPLITGITTDAGVSGSDFITNDGTLVFTGTADAYSVIQFFLDGAQVGDFVTADGSGVWSLDLTATTLASGTYSIQAVATDPAGNGRLGTARSLVVDRVAPELTISTDDPSLSINDTAAITFSFSESPVGFTESDIVLTGGLSLVSGSFTQVDATTYRAVVQAATHLDGRGSVTVLGSSFADVAGNAGVVHDLDLAIHTQTPSVFWRNGVSGELRDWLMKDGLIGSNLNLGALPSNWKILSDGDFNTDGITDLVWMNSSNREVRTFMLADNGTAVAKIIGTALPTWSIIASGDFNGDGTSDLLWRDSATGQMRSWEMSNGLLAANKVIAGPLASWVVEGIGDFNGDGTDDILWRNTADGQVREWTMLNSAYTTNTWLPTLSAAWQVAATGDFNGDGTDDILLHNTSTGEVRSWSMVDRTIASNLSLGTMSSDWQVVDAGDYDQDGTDDVIWVNSSTGAVLEWSIVDNAVAGTRTLGTLPSAWYATLDPATHGALPGI